MTSIQMEELAARIRSGSIRALARGLSWIESGGDRAEELSEKLYADTGHAHVVGVTGASGVGKSTLVSGLAREARQRGISVGVLAVDPSSPFSGGAILGDRIRMNELAGDPGVFIRSMATRGCRGGLCAAAGAAVDLVSASGRELVLVETVGVGQDEVDVMRVAHTTVVVSVPGLGDDIQALKAGIIEIADIHVVNKADREGADQTIAQLRALMAMDSRPAGRWQPPIVACVATRQEGAAALLDTLSNHLNYLTFSGELRQREWRIAESRVLKHAQTVVAETLKQPIAWSGDAMAAEIDRVARRKLSPYRCARALLRRASETERTAFHV